MKLPRRDHSPVPPATHLRGAIPALVPSARAGQPHSCVRGSLPPGTIPAPAPGSPPSPPSSLPKGTGEWGCEGCRGLMISRGSPASWHRRGAAAEWRMAPDAPSAAARINLRGSPRGKRCWRALARLCPPHPTAPGPSLAAPLPLPASAQSIHSPPPPLPYSHRAPRPLQDPSIPQCPPPLASPT